MSNYDFCGWATRNDLKCSDGRVIIKDAFKHNDGKKVPLIWNHQHNNVDNVLGHALLENRDEGVYAYCTLNNTPTAQNAKELVEHGDIVALSINANQLRQNGNNVMHGEIREVSLVLAGANPGAFIESVIRHGEVFEEEGVIYTGMPLELSHAEEEEGEGEMEPKELEHAEAEVEKAEGEETIEDVINSMSEKQKNVLYYAVSQALEHSDESEGIEHSDELEEIEESEGGDNIMKHNVFEGETRQANTLSHADVEAIFKDAKRCGSLKEACLAHAEKMEGLMHSDEETIYAEKKQNYGINTPDFLFPDARNLNPTPEFIKREMGWVSKVMHGTHHTPFSRIKSVFADITEEDARAKGYIKGKMKKEEVFTLLKRTTTPTTIYKKQKMDRDDIIDIADFDVVSWLKSEMRMMLDEEIARAVLVGDGRSTSSDDHINELNIRPIWKDEDLYTFKAKVTVSASATEQDKAKAFIKTVVKSRKNYKGSGNPTLFTTEDMLTDCLLIEDQTGRIIYDSIDKLKSALRVSDIVTVPVMEGLERETEDGNVALMGLIVNLKDYNIGADKGGAVNMFDDFDIDYNQQKYLIETRCSGALVKPYSAIAVELSVTA